MEQQIRIFIVRQAQTGKERDGEGQLHLTEYGQEQVSHMRVRWAQQHIAPSVVISSTATPVLETARIACPEAEIRSYDSLYYGKDGPQRVALMKAHKDLGPDATLAAYLASEARTFLIPWGERARQCVVEMGLIPARQIAKPHVDIAVFTHGVLAQALVHAFTTWSRSDFLIQFPSAYIGSPLPECGWVEVSLTSKPS